VVKPPTTVASKVTVVLPLAATFRPENVTVGGAGVYVPPLTQVYPAGSESAMLAPVTASGPALLSTSVNRTVSPPLMLPLPSASVTNITDLARLKSETSWTVGVTVASSSSATPSFRSSTAKPELGLLSGSAWLEAVIWAWFV